MAAGLRHLGLAVRDIDRAADFYATWFGFDQGPRQQYPDGTVFVRNADGFDLALHRVDTAVQLPEFFHFGFRAQFPDEVKRTGDRLRGAGVELFDVVDDPDLVSFKCLDPDGYRVEVYWE
jgi:catechol 2,3-dioxygenase-like lactoylglutathione lyase family enzyme